MRPRDRVFVALGICLPVPVIAATGLSLPLPATVERLATDLVPFARPLALPEGGVAGGSIVLTEAELRQPRPRDLVSHPRVAQSVPHAPRELAERRTAPVERRVKPSGDETQPIPVTHPVAPDPAPVALPVLSPRKERLKDDEPEREHEEREHEPEHATKPEHEPEEAHETKPKPKHEHGEKKKKKKPKKEPKSKQERQAEEKPKGHDDEEVEQRRGDRSDDDGDAPSRPQVDGRADHGD